MTERRATATSDMTARLRAAGFELPVSTTPGGHYVPFTQAGDLVFVAGQTPVRDGVPQYLGTVGDTISIEQAQRAAEICALNVLGQLLAACAGDAGRVRRCLRLGVFERCRDDFTRQPQVADAASDLIVLALGEHGRHARTSVGSNALPRGVPVEIEAIFEISPA